MFQPRWSPLELSRWIYGRSNNRPHWCARREARHMLRFNLYLCLPWTQPRGLEDSREQRTQRRNLVNECSYYHLLYHSLIWFVNPPPTTGY